MYKLYIMKLSNLYLNFDKNSCVLMNKLLQTQTLSMQSGLIYILPMLNNRPVKLLTIYITLHTPLCNIFVKKEKYHEFQLCGAITNFFHTIIFKLKEYYITSLLGQNIFSLKMNMFYMCSHSSTQMETLLDNLPVKAIITDLLV